MKMLSVSPVFPGMQSDCRGERLRGREKKVSEKKKDKMELTRPVPSVLFQILTVKSSFHFYGFRGQWSCFLYQLIPTGRGRHRDHGMKDLHRVRELCFLCIFWRMQ
jgi:hypothetical protein